MKSKLVRMIHTLLGQGAVANSIRSQPEFLGLSQILISQGSQVTVCTSQVFNISLSYTTIVLHFRLRPPSIFVGVKWRCERKGNIFKWPHILQDPIERRRCQSAIIWRRWIGWKEDLIQGFYNLRFKSRGNKWRKEGEKVSDCEVRLNKFDSSQVLKTHTNIQPYFRSTFHSSLTNAQGKF